jgi:excisionase family DNA binding protein
LSLKRSERFEAEIDAEIEAASVFENQNCRFFWPGPPKDSKKRTTVRERDEIPEPKCGALFPAVRACIYEGITSTDKRPFTVLEAAQYLAISPITVYHWISRREIQVVRLRRKAVRLDKQVLH